MVSSIWKEWYVMVCVIFHHMATGYLAAFPSILVSAVDRNSTEIIATQEELSWFVACYGVTGPIGYLVIPALMQMYGRKFISVLLNSIIFVGSVVIALAPGVHTLIIGRSIQGLAFSSVYVFCIIIAEYTHPKRRGFFIAFKLIWFSVGVLLCRVLGFTLTWRQTAWFGAIPAAMGAIGTMMWVESPFWLAYKGRFESCTTAFEWLRGKDLESRNELKQLVETQQELRKQQNKTRKTFLGALNAFRTKDFMKPLLIISVVLILLELSDGFYLIAYMIQIMSNLTGDQSKAYYYTVCLDIMKPIAIVLSTIIVNYFNRRTILFISGSLAVVSLGLMCSLHYIDEIGFINMKWLTPITLIAYCIICNLGINPIGVVLKGEIFPLTYKGVGVCVSGITNTLASIATLKLTLTMLLTLGVHGTFAIYLFIMLTTLVILYLILPETKDRTLQCIESNFLELNLPLKVNEADVLL